MWMANKGWATTTNLWLEVVDYYNAGLDFKEIADCIHNKFYQFGIPSGASTSIRIDLYGNYSDSGIEEIAMDMYFELDELLREKNHKKVTNE